jgi:hypothetical protein
MKMPMAPAKTKSQGHEILTSSRGRTTSSVQSHFEPYEEQAEGSGWLSFVCSRIL